MKTPPLPDTTVTEALLQGDPAAWNRFFDAYAPLIGTIVAWPKWHFDFHTREDVAQAIRLAITQSVERLRSADSLPAFVRRICFNHCIDRLRKELREQKRLRPLGQFNDEGEWEETDIAADDTFDPAAELVRQERAEAVRLALADMNDGCRALIREFYGQGHSYREIAENHRLPINTVGSRLSRCLDKLRSLIDRLPDPPRP